MQLTLVLIATGHGGEEGPYATERIILNPN
jgi:hypothetical protein